MQRTLKALRDGSYAVIPGQEEIKTGPRIGVQGDPAKRGANRTKMLAIGICGLVGAAFSLCVLRASRVSRDGEFRLSADLRHLAW